MSQAFESSKMYEESERRNSAEHALAKVHNIEQIQQEKGWQWIQISPHTQLFIPCDKNGNPTEKGLLRIAKIKQHLGIK